MRTESISDYGPGQKGIACRIKLAYVGIKGVFCLQTAVNVSQEREQIDQLADHPLKHHVSLFGFPSTW